jgi:Group II intron, maturase-specific domain
VICCRSSADEALAAMRDRMRRLKLAVNDRKTHVCQVPEGRFNFLGYTFGRLFSPRTGRGYLAPKPTPKKVQSVCRLVSDMTGRRWTLMGIGDRVARLNQLLVGWSNYFSLGTVSPAYRAIDQHVARRVRQWLRAKFRVNGRGTKRFSDDYLYRELGLVRLAGRRGNIPWAKACCFLREPDAGNPPVRFDERAVATGDGRSWGTASVLRPAVPLVQQNDCTAPLLDSTPAAEPRPGRLEALGASNGRQPYIEGRLTCSALRSR